VVGVELWTHLPSENSNIVILSCGITNITSTNYSYKTFETCPNNRTTPNQLNIEFHYTTRMPSLLLTTFLLQLTLHLINTIGTTTINEFLWNLYTTLFPSTSQTSSKVTTLKREVVRLKRDLSATSAQDDFARWAKLKRQHDKAVAEYDKLSMPASSLYLIKMSKS